MEELIRSLEERRSGENYTKIKYITGLLGPMGEFGRDILLKNPEPMEQGKIYEYNHQASDLLAALGEIADREERRLPPPLSSFDQIVRQGPYPVAGKAAEILERLKRGITSFRLLFRGEGGEDRPAAAVAAGKSGNLNTPKREEIAFWIKKNWNLRQRVSCLPQGSPSTLTASVWPWRSAGRRRSRCCTS